MSCVPGACLTCYRFQNVVPISLYLSLEVVVTLQAAWIYLDKDIWYEKLDQPATARSWNLASDLGQVEYIFSDKTGTLTQVRSPALLRFHVSANSLLESDGLQTMHYWRQGLSWR